MKTRYAVALAMLAGVAVGAFAVEGLHAQAKLKAYTVTETETIDATAQAEFAKAATAAQLPAVATRFALAAARLFKSTGRRPPSA